MILFFQGDTLVKVKHPVASRDKQEGPREDAASASGGKSAPCLKPAAVGEGGALDVR